MNKKNIQDNDLKNVSGGRLYATPQPCQCKGCQTEFDMRYVDSKYVKTGSGCHEELHFKCPHCGKWVDEYGNVKE